MLAVIATIKVKPGMESQFEGVAKQLVAKVNANETGCKLYQLHKGEAAATYYFIERYVDDEAVKAHRGSDHFRSLGKEMGAFMDGAPQILRLTEV